MDDGKAAEAAGGAGVDGNVSAQPAGGSGQVCFRGKRDSVRHPGPPVAVAVRQLSLLRCMPIHHHSSTYTYASGTERARARDTPPNSWNLFVV